MSDPWALGIGAIGFWLGIGPVGRVWFSQREDSLARRQALRDADIEKAFRLMAELVRQVDGQTGSPADDAPALPDWFYRDWTMRDVANWQRLAEEGQPQARETAVKMLAGYEKFKQRRTEEFKAEAARTEA
jgi:sugar phosphate isomerase/epimerase